MKTFTSSLCLFVFIIYSQNIISQTESDYKAIKSANSAYSEGNYQKAAELYEKVLGTGFTSSELNYNLGNTYYRLKDYKKAILFYERALLLNPDDDNIKTNLEFAQKYIQDKIEILPKFFLVRWGNSFINNFSSSGWAIISIITFIIFLSLTAIFLFSKNIRFRKLSVYIGFFSILISIIGFYCASVQNQKITNHSTAIVFSPSVTVKSSPDNNGTDLFIIHEGLKVIITGESNGWKEIKLSDGKIGWLPKESIEVI